MASVKNVWSKWVIVLIPRYRLNYRSAAIQATAGPAAATARRISMTSRFRSQKMDVDNVLKLIDPRNRVAWCCACLHEVINQNYSCWPPSAQLPPANPSVSRPVVRSTVDTSLSGWVVPTDVCADWENTDSVWNSTTTACSGTAFIWSS